MQLSQFLKKKIKKKELETNANFNFDNHYLKCKNKLEQIYQVGIKIKLYQNEIKIRSKSDWYEFDEKSSKSFLNLEK